MDTPARPAGHLSGHLRRHRRAPAEAKGCTASAGRLERARGRVAAGRGQGGLGCGGCGGRWDRRCAVDAPPADVPLGAASGHAMVTR